MLGLNDDVEPDFAVQVWYMQYDVVFHSVEHMPDVKQGGHVATWVLFLFLFVKLVEKLISMDMRKGLILSWGGWLWFWGKWSKKKLIHVEDVRKVWENQV